MKLTKDRCLYQEISTAGGRFLGFPEVTSTEGATEEVASEVVDQFLEREL